MVDKRAIKKYKIRRDGRLKKRGFRLDVDWEEEKHPRDEDGKFAPGNGGGAVKAEPKSRGSTPKFGKTNSAGDFKSGFSKLRSGMKPDKRWRVSDDYSVDDYKGMDKYMNENGSTFALHGTDIVSVAANAEKGDRGRDILADAVKAGGNKLDAYAGIYGFYQKCGFEPVSWTKWDDEYANDDWLEANGFTREQWNGMKEKPGDEQLAVKREPIVFFKYTGKVNTTPLEEFMKMVEPKEYDEAYKERDGKL